MSVRLLVDAPEFTEAVARDLAAASRTALVQAMTFEGDSAGLAIAALIRGCPAPDRRVLVDAFTRHVLSDHFRWSPRNIVKLALWREWSATRRMVRDLEQDGVAVRFDNPAGLCFRRFPARNHKKLVALDGRVAYFGGINFSDHNFGWHDLMLRVEEPRVARFLEGDFIASWEGRARASRVELDGLTLHALDGRSNEAFFDEILELVAQARDEVFLECPYVTDPFSRELERAARRGVRVRVLTPESHNFPLLREALAHAAARSPLELRLYPGRMTHMKALLVDRRALVVGSANFDVWSYRSQQEYVAVVREPGIVAEFERRVVEPDLACSRPWRGAPRARDARGMEAIDELHHERFEAALAAAAELHERFPADAAGPLAEANVYQTMMRDYRLRDHEAQFQAALAQARRLGDVEVRSRPDAEAFFARGTAQGYVAIHDSRCGRWLAALKHGLRCLDDMDEAARLDPGFVDPQLPMALHDYWRSRKLGLFFGGRRAGAIARMERVWKEGRYLQVEAAYSLVAVLQGEGQLERALEASNWLHERFPENPVCLYHRARILEGLGRREEALRTWDELVGRLVASGRVSHGFQAECQLHRARLLAAPGESGTASQEHASAALALASEHARLRNPELEMDGPFEGFDDVKEAIARLAASLEKNAARLRASR